MNRFENERYFEVFRDRYHRQCKREKGKLLDEFCSVVGCSRKRAIRLLSKRKPGRKPNARKRGSKSRYGGSECKKPTVPYGPDVLQVAQGSYSRHELKVLR